MPLPVPGSCLAEDPDLACPEISDPSEKKNKKDRPLCALWMVSQARTWQTPSAGAVTSDIPDQPVTMW